MMHGPCGPAEQQFQIYEWSCKSTSEVLLVVSCREAVCQIHKIFSVARLATPDEFVRKFKSRDKGSHLAAKLKSSTW